MRRIAPGSLCFGLATLVVLFLAAPATPRASNAESRKIPRALISETAMTAKAASVCGMVMSRPAPVSVSLSPRPMRERNGEMANTIDAYCYDAASNMLCYLCWDALTGDIVIFSRNDQRGLPRVSEIGREHAVDTAVNWLDMLTLNPGRPRWEITAAEARTARRWVMHAQSGERRANVFVDRRTGAVVSMTTWSDWPAEAKTRIAKQEGSGLGPRRNNG